MKPVIAAHALTAGYGSITVVRRVDLSVHAGEVVVLLGPNGAGKTTTILALAGELPPQSGQVLWNGTPTRAPLHWRAQRGLGLITEHRAVLMTLTVAQNLRLAHCEVDRALQLFPELSDHLDRRVSLLSGGQQQMLAMARSLARPMTSVLLADELSLGLAPIIVERLLGALRQAADGGMAVLLVEQHMHRALTVADRGYVMHRGGIVLSGRGQELLDRVGEIESSYLSRGTEAAPPGKGGLSPSGEQGTLSPASTAIP